MHDAAKFLAVVLSGIFLVLAAAWPVAADIYQYVDKHGVVHFTNVRTHADYRLFMRDGRRVAASFICDYEHIIHRAAASYGLEPALVKAIIRAESNFNYRAVSPKGAQGLMQLMPATAGDLQVANAFDPEENILAGVRYLSGLLKRFNNDTILALAAYNAGPERVESYQGVPPYKETREYIERVRNYYWQYCETSK